MHANPCYNICQEPQHRKLLKFTINSKNLLELTGNRIRIEMEDLKLTIQEAQEMLLMSQSSVYAWIDKGKLQTIDGPGGKVIVISPKEAEQIRELNLKSKRNKTSKSYINTTASFQETPIINAEILNNEAHHTTHLPNDTVTLHLITELKELAVETGKYKQLEIIRNEEKESRKYWEDKYFELHAKLIEKDLEISALKKQTEEQKTLLAKKSGIFGFLK